MPFTLPRSITVDFSTDADPQPIKAVQGDQTRVAKIILLNKGLPVNLTGLTVRAYVMPFGETVGLYEDVAVTDAAAGKVEYSLSGNACIKAGDGVVNIQVTETATGKQAYTDEIPLKVKVRKDFTGAIVGSTVFSALQSAIATALGLDAAAVHKAGAETITGLKSVPTPTAAEHIARKDYVDQNINFAAAKQCTAYAENKTVATATNTALALTVAAPYAGIAIITMGETVNEAAFSGVIEGKIMVGGVQKVRTAYKYASADYPAPQTIWMGSVASGAVITFSALHTKGSNAAMVFDINVAFMRIV